MGRGFERRQTIKVAKLIAWIWIEKGLQRPGIVIIQVECMPATEEAALEHILSAAGSDSRCGWQFFDVPVFFIKSNASFEDPYTDRCIGPRPLPNPVYVEEKLSPHPESTHGYL